MATHPHLQNPFSRTDFTFACLQVTGTGVGKGKTPMKGTYTVTVNNILTQGNVGDLDFPRAGDGEWGINWSFVKCPGTAATSRKMLEA